jgi:hypothetical protein
LIVGKLSMRQMRCRDSGLKQSSQRKWQRGSARPFLLTAINDFLLTEINDLNLPIFKEFLLDTSQDMPA